MRRVPCAVSATSPASLRILRCCETAGRDTGMPLAISPTAAGGGGGGPGPRRPRGGGGGRGGRAGPRGGCFALNQYEVLGGVVCRESFFPPPPGGGGGGPAGGGGGGE